MHVEPRAERGPTAAPEKAARSDRWATVRRTTAEPLYRRVERTAHILDAEVDRQLMRETEVRARAQSSSPWLMHDARAVRGFADDEDSIRGRPERV